MEKKISMIRNNISECFPFPVEGEQVYEKTPVFVWVLAEGASGYRLTVFDAEGSIIGQKETGRHYASLDMPLEPGTYSYIVQSDNGWKSDRIAFSIAENALLFERPTVQEVLEGMPRLRPRHLFAAEDIPMLLQTHRQELKGLKENVRVALNHGMPARPDFHHSGNELRFRRYFGDFRLYCDRDLVACALYYALTGDVEAGKHGKELLITICDWNPDGPCSVDGEWGDEVGLSCIRCLPAAFDLLYPLLDTNERHYIACTIAHYAWQCERRLGRLNYERNPSESHAGRVPAYLGEAALALADMGVVEESVIHRWLAYALDVYCGIFPFYGQTDGSWAEGAFYSTSYTKWYLPFFSAVERFSGKSLMNRPFYHRYTDFLIHFCNPAYEIHPFGDGYWCDSASEEWPGFFAQNPYRVYAERFGPRLALERMQQASSQEIYMLHLLDLFLPWKGKVEKSLVKEPENLAVFPKGGFVAMHTDLYDRQDICVLTRASRFPYDSHRHADQGSFALFAGGVALISPSGYFGWRYGTNHHMKWTKSTAAHNALLFDGVGQEAVDIRYATGEIVDADKENNSCVLDLSSAYSNITLWQRRLILEGNTLTVQDLVEAEQAVEVTYPLHMLSGPKAQGNKVILERKGVRLTVIPEGENLVLAEITDKWGVDLNDGVPADLAVEMPVQYHVTYKTGKARQHEITVRFQIDWDPAP